VNELPLNTRRTFLKVTATIDLVSRRLNFVDHDCTQYRYLYRTSGVLWVTEIKISSCWSWTIVDH